jgi:myo-inositol 2-dehydrogenase / D-chiro-inositol 1-dehydrogenase
MGAYHGATLGQRLPGARLAAVADPAPGAAETLAAALGAGAAYTDPAEAFADPAVEAVVIAAPARFHADLVVAAAGAGKAVFCEKPMGLQLADIDRAIDAARPPGWCCRWGSTGGSPRTGLRRGRCWTTGRWVRLGWCGR